MIESIYHTLIGLVYLQAFYSLYIQYTGILSYNGLLPIDLFMNRLQQTHNSDISSTLLLSLVKYLPVEGLTDYLMISGCMISIIIMTGCHSSLLYLICWLHYLILYLMGRETFLSFQWDTLLLEVGFLCIFTAPYLLFPSLSTSATSTLRRVRIGTVWCIRFLAFKLMFLSGVVKLQALCPTWIQLTALEYHFATQCIPTPLAWYAHQLPPLVLRLAVAATLLIEIPCSVLLIVPSTIIRRVGVVGQIVLQVSIMLTGNYTFFNILTIALMLPSWIDDDAEVAKAMVVANSMKKESSIIATFKSTFKHPLSKLLQFLVAIVYIVAYWNIYFQWNDNMITTRPQLWENIVNPYLYSTLLMVLTVVIYSVVVDELYYCYCTITFLNSPGSIGIMYRCVTCALYDIAVPVTWILFSFIPCISVCRQLQHMISSYALDIYSNYLQKLSIHNSYGLFRRMTGVGTDSSNGNSIVVSRPEIVLEGLYRHNNSKKGATKATTPTTPTTPTSPTTEIATDAHNSNEWIEIPFRYKPSVVTKPLQFVAPHQPRMDWQMWFAALGGYSDNPWLLHLIYNLLLPKDSNLYSEDIHQLLDTSSYPFNDDSIQHPPLAVRSSLYMYDFTYMNTTWNKHRINKSGSSSSSSSDGGSELSRATSWWQRQYSHEYLFPIDLSNESFIDYMRKAGYARGYKSTNVLYAECVDKINQSGSSVGYSYISTAIKEKMICSGISIRNTKHIDYICASTFLISFFTAWLIKSLIASGSNSSNISSTSSKRGSSNNDKVKSN